MEFLDEPQESIPTQQDNRASSTVALTGDSKNGKLKHVLAKLYRVREAVDTNLICIFDTRTSDMKADCLTKPLQGHSFRVFVNDILGLSDSSI